MTYVDLDWRDYRRVQVRLDDGRWVDAWLEAYRKVGGVWSGFVRYSLGVGETYIDWVDEDGIRAHGQ